jgi:Uma2 family endonuclease
MKPSSAARVTRGPVSASRALFLLESGARMDQPTFHTLYKQTPEGFRAQLVGGTVYVMASPTSPRHGRPHARVVYWLCAYAEDTPGTDVLDNTTNILGPESEPEPDAALLLQPEYGGQTALADDVVVGAPELVVEVANSSLAIDLGRKKTDYEQAGVKEYIVVMVEDQSVVWFRRQAKKFAELPAGADGVFRSEAFPGLWLDPHGMFDPTTRRITSAVRNGLASPEHAAFIADLAARRQAKPASKKSRKSK